MCIQAKVRTKDQGFSLIEVMVGIALISIIIGLASLSFGGSNEKLHASALAKTVHDTLLQCRTKARSLGQPVGTAFPGTGTFAAQALYQVVGVKRMRVERPRDFSGEFSRGYVTWAPLGSESLNDLITLDPYDLATMNGLIGDDPLVLFLPSGDVLVRGLPFDGENYHLRVGSQPAGSSGGLTGLTNAWDILISPTGAIELGRDSSVPPGGGSPPALAALPSASSPPTSIPVVNSLTAHPELVDKGTGLSLASPGQPVNLVATASSPNGLPLQVRWSADGGQFSDDSGWLPMTYSLDDDLWKSSILWSLPDLPDPIQNVSVEVRDEYGNASASTSVSQLAFDTAAEFPWEVFFVSRTSSSLVSDVERVNGDGSGRVELIENESRPPRILVSPNGELLGWRSGDYTRYNEIHFSSRDGTKLRTVTLPQDVTPLAWSPDGTRLVVNDYGVNPTRIWEINPTTGAVSVFATLPTEVTLYSVSADLRYYAYRTASNRLEAVVFDRNTGTEQLIFTGASGGYGPVDLQLSASGAYCGFYDQTGPGHRTILARTDGSGHIDLGWGGVAYVSPDDSTVVYTSNSAARGGTTIFVVADIDGTTRYTDPALIDYSSLYTPDSKFVLKQARMFSDNRLIALELDTGRLIEVIPDEDLSKFSLSICPPR